MRLAVLSAAATLFALSAGAASATIVSGDFRSSNVVSGLERNFERLGAAVTTPAAELTVADEIRNDGLVGGFLLDLDPATNILSVEAIDDASYFYDEIFLDVTNIGFDSSEQIASFVPISVGAVGEFPTTFSFTADSLSITYGTAGTSFGITPGAVDTYQIALRPRDGSAEVPVPAALPLLAGALAVFGLIRRRA